MPDMIVRLLGQNGSYNTAFRESKATTWQLNKQLDSLTASMERELNVSEMSARQAQVLALADKGAAESMERELNVSEMSARQSQVLALADKGASASKIEYAMSLASQLDAQEQLNAAEAEAAALAARKKAADDAKQASIDKVTSALKRQAFEAAHGADAIVLYDLKAKGASETELKLATRLLDSIAAHKQMAGDKLAINKENDAAEKAHTATLEQNEAWIKKTISAGHERNRMQGVSIAYLTMKEMKERGATEAQIDEWYATHRLNQALDQQNAKRERQNQLLSANSGKQDQFSTSSTKNLFAVQALAFGIQDAAQVYGTTGLAGALSASANNLIFMTSILSPHLAIVTAITVAGGQFAAVLLPMAMNTNGLREAEEALVEAQKKRLELTLDLNKAQREFNQAMEDANSRNEAEGLAKKTLREGNDIAAEIADREQALRDLMAARQAAEEKSRNVTRHDSTLGGAMRSMGFIATPGTAEIEGIDKLIAEQQEKLAALDRQKGINEKNQGVANQKAAFEDRRAHEEESHKFNKERQKERLEEDIKADKKKREDAEEAQKKFAKEFADLQKRLTIEVLSEEQERRQKIVMEMGERQAKIDKWLHEGRISLEKAQAFHAQSRRAAANELGEVDKKIAEKQMSEQKSALTESLRKQEENLKNLRDTHRGKDLTAVEANSAEGMRRIFEALGGTVNPQREIAQNTAGVLAQLIVLKEFAEKQLDAINNWKPIKTQSS